MEQVKYKIEFFDFWHTSSGLSAGTDVDMTVIKNDLGLPYIPGKTLKGLLREAAENIKSVNSELITDTFIIDVFGEIPKKNYREEQKTKEAKSFFGNATLSKAINEEVVRNKDLSEGFYKTIASTRIDEKGQAEKHSLRQMEVVIPLELYASIENITDKAYIEQLKHCFSYIKRLGLNRNKGLGRSKFSLLNN